MTDHKETRMARFACTRLIGVLALYVSGNAWGGLVPLVNPPPNLPDATEALQTLAAPDQENYAGPFNGGPHFKEAQGQYGTATAEAGLNPAPFLSAFTEYTDTAAVAIATAGLDYYFMGNGPDQYFSVIFSGDIVVTTSEVQTLLNGALAGIENVVQVDTSGCNFTNGSCPFSIRVPGLVSGTAYHVGIAVIAEALGGLPPVTGMLDASDSVKMDPTVTIDPSTPDANEFTLAFSSGVGNSSPIPEPTSLILVGIGLAGIVVRYRYLPPHLSVV
jgi:hypothetical protein